MDIIKIKRLLESKHLTQKELSEKIGISQTALTQLIARGDLRVSTLEKISDVLEVPTAYFFEDNTKQNEPPKKLEINGNGININIKLSEAEKEIEHLKLINKQLEERIKDKIELIEVLKTVLLK